MATIAQLRFGTGIDGSGAATGLKGTGRDIDRFVESSEKKLKAIQAPKLDAAKAAGGDTTAAAQGQASELAAALLPVAAQVKRAVWAAVQPLTQFAARFSAQFDKVGGALIGISQRIDEAMKFPKFEARIGALREKIRRFAGLMPKDLQDGANKSSAVAPHFEPMIGQFASASDRIKVSVGVIPEALQGAISRAERIRANLDPLVGDFENAAKRIGDPVVPPADGAGYGLDKGARSRAAQAQPRGPGGKFASKQAADAFTPTPATADQLPARAGAAKVIHGKWEIDAKALDASVGKFNQVAKVVQAGASQFGPYGKAAAVGIATATTAVNAGVGTISGVIKAGAKVADVALAAYLGWEKLKGFWGTLGSVAEKTIGKIAAIRPPPFKFDLSTTINQIQKVGSAATTATAPMINFGKSFAVGLGAFGFAFKAAQFVKDGVKEASDLNETISATEAILGEAAPAVTKFSDQMGKEFGFVKRETLEAASGFGGLGKGLANLSGPALADFSTKFTKMAGDLSSFKNLDFKEASSALRTVLSGEQSDTLKKMGVIINETTTKQYALANAIGKVGEELNEEQKFLARAGQLTEALKDASGDLEKTQGGAANQLRKLQGSITNVGAAIGSALLPILTRGLAVLNKLVGAGAALFGANSDVLTQFSAVATAAIGRFEQVVEAATPAILDFGKMLAGALTQAGSALYAILPSFGQVVDFGKTAFATVAGAVMGVYRFLVGIPSAIDGAFGAGTAMMVLKAAATFAAVAGALMLVAPLVTGAIPLIGGLISSFMGVVPVIAAVATTVLGLTTRFVSLGDLAAGAGWAIRNAGDLAGVAWVYLTDKVEHAKAVFFAIPEILGTIGAYVRDNWLKVITGALAQMVTHSVRSLITLSEYLWEGFKGIASFVGKILWEIPGVLVKVVGAVVTGIGGLFASLWENFKNFGDMLKKFVQNPTGGIDWKLPELKLPEFKGAGNEIDRRLAAIAEKEKAFQAAKGKPFELPPTAAQAVAEVKPPARPDTTKAEFAAKAAEKAQNELESFAKSFKTKVQSPLEEYSKVMDKAKKALEAGLITKAEFAKADAYAKKESGIDERKVSAAMELGSKEAYSSIVSALYGRGDAEPVHLAQQSLKVQQEQSKTLTRINNKISAARDPIQITSVA